MVIYSGLIYILHMLLVFFIDMSLNILSFFIKFFISFFANFGSGGMSDIHLKSVQHRVQSQRTVGALAWRVKMRMSRQEYPAKSLYKQGEKFLIATKVKSYQDSSSGI
jgi:hypothetical protein